jgi:hypothetical protein
MVATEVGQAGIDSHAGTRRDHQTVGVFQQTRRGSKGLFKLVQDSTPSFSKITRHATGHNLALK